MVLVYVVGQFRRLNQTEMDGTYVSECCGTLVLKAGTLEHGRDRAPFRVARYKFGLVAEVGGRLTSDGIERQEDGSVLQMSENTQARSVATVVAGRDVIFTEGTSHEK